MRVTVRAADEAAAAGALDAEEAEIRRILAEAAGDVVFGVDDEAIEDAVARALAADGLTLGLAESLTGGLAASRLVNVPGASGWFRGSVVSYASEVKYDVLGVPEGPVVSEDGGPGHGRRAPAGCSVPTSGCRSPGWPVPTPRTASRPAPSSSAWPVRATRPRRSASPCPGDRDRVRQYATIAALDLLRRSLAPLTGRPAAAPAGLGSAGLSGLVGLVVVAVAATAVVVGAGAAVGVTGMPGRRQLHPGVAGLQGDRDAAGGRSAWPAGSGLDGSRSR